MVNGVVVSYGGIVLLPEVVHKLLPLCCQYGWEAMMLKPCFEGVCGALRVLSF